MTSSLELEYLRKYLPEEKTQFGEEMMKALYLNIIDLNFGISKMRSKTLFISSPKHSL